MLLVKLIIYTPLETSESHHLESRHGFVKDQGVLRRPPYPKVPRGGIQSCFMFTETPMEAFSNGDYTGDKINMHMRGGNQKHVYK